MKEQITHLTELDSSIRVWVRRALDESRPRIDLDANRGAIPYPTESAGEHAAFISGERPKHSPHNLTAETIPHHRV